MWFKYLRYQLRKFGVIIAFRYIFRSREVSRNFLRTPIYKHVVA